MNGNICLTFDFDAISVWIQRDMKTMSSISRGEFGAVAVERLLHLLKSRNIKSTFFVPGHTIETYPSVCQKIVDDGHEIALHGYDHENFNQLTAAEEWEVLQHSYEVANKFLGHEPKGFRSPSWEISSRTIENLEKLGITYDSSQMGDDYGVYYSRKGDTFEPRKPAEFGPKSSIIEIPVAWSMDDYPYLEFLRSPAGVFPGLQKPRDMFENWTGDVEYMIRDFENGVLVATVHPQVSGRGHRFLALEDWVDSLIKLGISFSRMDHVAEKFLTGEKFGEYKPKYPPIY